MTGILSTINQVVLGRKRSWLILIRCSSIYTERLGAATECYLFGCLDVKTRNWTHNKSAYHYASTFGVGGELIHGYSSYSDSLRAGWSGDRIPVGARFSVPIQTGPGNHPASYTMGTGFFPGLKWPGRGVDHPSQSSAEIKERVGLYLYSPPRPSWSVLGWTYQRHHILTQKDVSCTGSNLCIELVVL